MEEAIYQAFELGNFSKMADLVQRNVDVNVAYRNKKNPNLAGITPLIACVHLVNIKMTMRLLDKGASLYQTDALGRTAIVTKEILPANTNQALAIIRLNDSNLISKEFLIRVLTSESILNQVSLMKGGVAQQNLSLAQLKDFLIPLPSLATQNKIVAKLDAIFAEIDTATAAAEANAKNAEALFQSYLTEFFELEAKNNTSLLGEVCNVIGGGTPSKANDEFYTGTIPWATVRDMNKDNLDITDYKITEEAVRLSATNIIPANNVVIATRVGLGKVCILNQDTAINQDLRGVIPKSNDILDVNYLFLWFKFVAEKIIQAGRGATVQGVTLPFIKSLAIPVPTLINQQNTVVKIQSIFNNTELAKNSYITKINELAVLKQSILQRAFSGELVKD